MGYFKKTGKDVKEISSRFYKRDFSGDEGQVIKNSTYQISTQLVAKFGSLIFTVIVARMLMPELFGLYNLAISTIMVFAAFSDFGLGSSLIRFVSSKVSQKKLGKAKSYFTYIIKLKILLLVLVIFILMISAHFLATSFYQKPLFLALIAGSVYLFFMEISSILKSSYQSINKFELIFTQEIIFQTLRIIFVSSVIFLSLNYLVNEELLMFYIVLALSTAAFISFLFLFSFSKKTLTFLEHKKSNITKREKSNLNKFILAVSVTALSGIFFSYIDKIMLGGFVDGEFIGYYSAAFSFIGASIPIITFSAALLPIFSRLTRNKLEPLFRKSREIIMTLSIILMVFFLIFAPLLINIVFGELYAPSVEILRIFSVVLIIMSANALFSTYLTAIGKPLVITKSLIISSILNVILNYILISWLVNYSQLAAVYGAVFATITSNFVYLILMFYFNKSYN